MKPAAPIFPVLDKSHLFVHLPTDPQNQSTRYVQCPATGHLYCMSTGSLYRKIPIIPLSTNILFLPQGEDSCLLPSIPPPSPMKTFSVCTKNMDQQDIGPSTTVSIENNLSPKVKVVDEPIQGNSATQSNKAPNVTNADQHIQNNGASTILNTKSNITPEVKHRDQLVKRNNAVEPAQGNEASSKVKHAKVKHQKTTSKVKHASQPIQCNSPSVISYRQHKNNPNVMKADQPIQGTSASITPNTYRNEAFENKPYTYAQVASRLRGAYSSVFIQRNFDPTTKENIKMCSRKVKNKSAPLLEQSCASSKKKSASRKQKKSTGRPQPKPTIIMHKSSSSCTNNSGNVKNTASIPQTTKKSQSTIHPNNYQSKKKRKKNKRKSHTNSGQHEKNAKRIPVSSSNSNVKCAPGYTEQDFFKIWAIVKPFNRRPHLYRNRQKSLLSSQCKNCIMASSVHEIIHSPFSKDTNEHMPVSQIKAMLSSGDRKLRTRKEWIQCMEEEAIHKYKKMSLEKNNQRLKVKEYEVQRHIEKYYLACASRLVINRKDGDSWPLLVKCLHKHPDSTLRQACKHRSFCLSWDGTSYTLRRDHAYYTEIQCHMAVTEMSYAELIVHTHKETTILPVYFDSDFWKQTDATLETFFTGNILPYLKKTQSNLASAPLVSDHSNDEIEE